VPDAINFLIYLELIVVVKTFLNKCPEV